MEGFKPHQRGGGCCSSSTISWWNWEVLVSNTISGEVGAAAIAFEYVINLPSQFQTPSAGRWVLQPNQNDPSNQGDLLFQTPSAGRWVLQHTPTLTRETRHGSFKPHQRGGGCCSAVARVSEVHHLVKFQTPSAGRWVLQPFFIVSAMVLDAKFQTPSAGRWVLQLRAGSGSRADAGARFKPHQRGGGCCSPDGYRQVRGA